MMRSAVFSGRLRRSFRRGLPVVLLIQVVAAVLLVLVFYKAILLVASAELFPYIRVMEVTAYTAGTESTGKDEAHPDFGVTASTHRLKIGAGEKCIAAPPEFNFGTRIVVPGYGVGVVKDRGEAIVGDRLDIYFDELDSAHAWGRKTLKVVIIP